ncbi:MAG: thermonuclease family protein [Deltaproteobacteria bacterium]|nr:thermonuclease family protein [Deltaproteobacteria bacterium]
MKHPARILLYALLLSLPLSLPQPRPLAAGVPPKPFGPYPAIVERVIDGDTIQTAIELWPGLVQHIHLRLLGVNAPEIHGKNIAPCEKAAGQKAKAFVERLLQGAKTIIVTQVKPDKYGGRALGRMEADGQDVSARLLKAGLAVVYNGGKREKWGCR